MIPRILACLGYLVSLFSVAALTAAESVLSPYGSIVRGELRDLRSRLPQWMQDGFRLQITIHLARAVAMIAASFCAWFLGGTLSLPWRITVWVILLAGIPLLGEVLPRARYARSDATDVERLALRFHRAHRLGLGLLVSVFLKPGNGLVRFLGGRTLFDSGATPNPSTEKVLDRLNGTGEPLPAAEEKMIRGVVELRETVVREVMIPRTQIDFIEVTAGLDEVLGRVTQSLHSRIPVIDEDVDHIVGILYSKELLRFWREADRKRQEVTESFSIEQYMRPPVYVPETKKVDELVREFQRERNHIAIVVDEYGGTAGLVTMEDLLEEIVGEIKDEFDQEAEPFEKREDGVYVVEGTMRIDEIRDELGIELPEEEGYDTVSGYLAAVLGRVPCKGERVHHGGLVLVVESADEKRVERVRISLEAES